MKATINEKKENSFLQRTEVKGIVQFEKATPSNAQLIEALSKELKAAPELIVIKNIYTRFAQRQADFLAYAYASIEARKKTEPVTAHMKKKSGEKKPEEKKEEKK